MSKLFIICEAVVAVCGFGLVVTRLAGWDGGPIDVLTLIFGAVMFLAGGSAAAGGMVQRQRGKRRGSYDS